MRIGNRNTDISIAPIKLKNLSLNLSSNFRWFSGRFLYYNVIEAKYYKTFKKCVFV